MLYPIPRGSVAALATFVGFVEVHMWKPYLEKGTYLPDTCRGTITFSTIMASTKRSVTELSGVEPGKYYGGGPRNSPATPAVCNTQILSTTF